MCNYGKSIRSLVLLSVVAAALAGCGKKSEEQASTPNSQVVARVGDQVVTVQELETEFRWSNVANDKRRDPEIVKRILGELVARKYLLQQATAAKLDREPTVLLDLLRAREQVLANALVSRQVATRASAMNQLDVDKYIANNPAKFANRQVVAVDQISFPAGANAQSVIDSTRDLTSLGDVDQKLTSMGIPHGRSSGTLNSAEMPDELLRLIDSKRSEDILFIRSGQNGIFLQIKGRETQPLTGEPAAALARQLLRAEMVKTEASMTSVAANMEAKYEGEYAQIMSDPSGKKPGGN
jgi:EpsD family peptidyl-prolyl cis-trans isomerase